MSLDIEVGEGEDLEIGVKSGYGAEANNTVGANHGKFYVDLVRTWKVSDLPVSYDENSAENEIVPRAYNNKVVLSKTFQNGEWQYVCLPFSLNQNDIETIFGKGTEVVGETEAGKPFRIRPTNVLPSPIVLENVRIETDTPQSLPFGGEGGGFITGTFQKTNDTPAFSATIIDDPDGIRQPQANYEGKDKKQWYDLGGSPVPFPTKGGIYVTKGKAVYK